MSGDEVKDQKSDMRDVKEKGRKKEMREPTIDYVSCLHGIALKDQSFYILLYTGPLEHML